MAVNIDYDTAWEDLHLVLQEIDKAALDSGDREAYLAYIQGALYGAETVGKGLQYVGDKANGIWKNEDGSIEVKLDQDILELMDMDPTRDDDPSDKARRYLEECLGCNFRAAFDFQFQPLSLLGPLEGFVNQIENVLNQLDARIDPFNMLKDLCGLLNDFDIFCLQDIFMFIMALKLLIKQYLLQAFDIKLDWTFLLAPILKLIVALVTAIIDALLALILGPLECTYSAVASIAQLENLTKDLANTALQTGQDFGNQMKNFQNIGQDGTNFFADKAPNLAWQQNTTPFGNTHQGFGKLQASTPDPGLSNFVFKPGQTLNDTLSDPAFATATATQSLAVAISSALGYMRQLGDNIKITIESLDSLVGGGIGLSINVGGIILMINDLISVLMMIARMKSLGLDVKDWCKYLEQNPDLLREQIAKEFGPVDLELTDIIINTEDSSSDNRTEFLIKREGQIVGSVPLCINARDNNTRQLLNQWIAELNQQ